MPASGDQHKPNGNTTTNPFEEVKPQISEYTAQEIATLQSRLNKRLGPEYISTRAGPGNQRVAYLSAEKAINLANEVFGFNGWSSSIQNIQIDFVDENATTGKVSIGLSVVIRVSLRDGTYHEDIGYGGIENCKGKIAAFEKAKKEGTTDALKRALRNFGNVLGNCIYDKEYITKVTKVKAGTGKWDVNELHRHADFVPKKEEESTKPVNNVVVSNHNSSNEMSDSFDVGDFDDADFDDADFGNPDEVLLPDSIGAQKQQTRPPSHNSLVTPSKQAPRRPPQVQTDPSVSALSSNARLPQFVGGIPAPNRPPGLGGPIAGNVNIDSNSNQRSSSPGIPSQHFGAPQLSGAPAGPPVAGFYSARAAGLVDQNNIPQGPAAPKFNPHAESPSIRKTQGVDHSKSSALNKHTLKPEVLPPKDIIDPKLDPTRRTGLPGSGPQSIPSPVSGRVGMSTSAYRPPTRHGPGSGPPPVPATSSGPQPAPERTSTATKRLPLGDVSNIQHSVSPLINDGVEAKRLKTGGEQQNKVGSVVQNVQENTSANN